MTTKEMLDMLAEYQSQRDGIEAKKRALLDEVKVPAEVMEVQNKANAEAQKADAFHRALIENLRRECDAKLAEITIPEEIRVALAEIDHKRSLVQAYQREKEMDYQASVALRKGEIFNQSQAQTAQVYADIAQRKADIEAEFSGSAAAVDVNIAKLREQIKEAAKAEGKTVNGKYYQAVYVKGRVTWNTDMLDGMIALVPQLEKARKEGEPSITIKAKAVK